MYTLTENKMLIQAKRDFYNYLDIKGNSLITYSKGIEKFLQYLNKKQIKTPTRDDFRAFRETLKQDMSVSTINCYMASIRRFFGYLQEKGYYDDITKDVKSLKTSKVPKKQVLTLEQIRNIYSGLTDKREKCLFSLAITTGLRGKEIAEAQIEDIKEYNGETVLWIKCKNHDAKDEYVKLADTVIYDIIEYTGDRNSGYIFTSTSNNNKGQGVTTKTLRLEIKKIFKRFGLDSDAFSLHSLRRSSATVAYLQGQDIYSIQQLLHHKSISTTQRYINSSTRDANKIEYRIADAIMVGGNM